MLPLICALNVVFADKPKLSPLPVNAVTLNDRFWAPRQRSLSQVTFQHELDMCKREGDLNNFLLAAQGAKEGFKGYVFQDSDTYKVIESIALGLSQKRDAKLEAQVDKIVADIAKAQLPDGYINTHFQIKGMQGAWKSLAWNHELYCLGHMIEGAIAYDQATGKKQFLNVTTRFADLAVKRFLDQKTPGYPGHPELELALVRLSEHTGNKRYLDLAEHFIVARGSGYFAAENNTPREKFEGAYAMDDVPITEHSEIKGHAVRAGYLLTGIVDLLRHRDNPALEAMLKRVWNNANRKRVFVTGGTGPSGSNEGFTTDYDLPTYSAYQETCASISYAMWNQRMALLFGDAKYADAMELALYNGALAGISYKGDRFFYVNPLASRGNHHRQDWFGCACCPPNIARTIAQIGSYAYGVNDRDIYVNLFVSGEVKTKHGNFKVETDYPWSGTVKFTATSNGKYGLKLRAPGWSKGAEITKSPVDVVPFEADKGYFSFNRSWKKGETVVMEIPMPVRRVAAHPLVKPVQGTVAFARGPLVYCLENADNAIPVNRISVAPTAPVSTKNSDLFGGIVTLHASGMAQPAESWGKSLYADLPTPQPVEVTAIPYFLWDNRKPGDMVVWVPTQVPAPRLSTPEGDATVKLSFLSGNAEISGINDGSEVHKSGEQPERLTHFWPHKGGTEWIEYSWPKARSIRGIELFWFDDTGRGECKLPKGWHVEIWQNGAWKTVGDAPKAQLDAWQSVNFGPIHTTKLRLVVEQQSGWASGVHEMRVIEAELDEN